MEVNTGAAISLLSEATVKTLLSRIKVRLSSMTLITYMHEQMKVLGKIEVNVEYCEQKSLSNI